MNPELSADGLGKLKDLRDQAQETHKTAGDASARVEMKDEFQPREEWRFREALRENADGLLDLAEMGLELEEMANALRGLLNVTVVMASGSYTGAQIKAAMVLRTYERKRWLQFKEIEENSGEAIETTL